MKKDFVMKLQKAKEDMSEAIKIQLATNEKLALTKKNLDGIMEASKLENVRISILPMLFEYDSPSLVPVLSVGG